MNKNEKLTKIRTKKLGLLLMDARKTHMMSIEECASAMGAQLDRYQSYEAGEAAPSLPELEAFAFHLYIPLSHFWGSQSLSQSKSDDYQDNIELVNQTRNHNIALKLNQLRVSSNQSQNNIADQLGISEDILNEYEQGTLQIPLPVLEALAVIYNVKIQVFFDQSGPVGKWLQAEDEYDKFKDLPVELQDFILKPVNHPYLELAKKISDVSAEKLRSIAEGLLEITF
jgi:transcriptional regulator with XRE-family HTH domain